MGIITFSRRCAKEILRDPLNISFGIGFPIILLLLLSTMQKNIPTDMFNIKSLAPGISIFGLSFMTLFTATLIAKDRESLLLQRLYTTPLTPTDYILGYMLPIIPFSVLQSVCCYIVAFAFRLPLNINILYGVLGIFPICIFYISLGLLCGSIFSVKQVGGICGALLTNLSAWLSGIWFDIKLLGKTFEKIANFLPFVHSVELEKNLINGDFNNILKQLIIIIIYSLITSIFAVFAFLKQMQKQ